MSASKSLNREYQLSIYDTVFIVIMAASLVKAVESLVSVNGDYIDLALAMGFMEQAMPDGNKILTLEMRQDINPRKYPHLTMYVLA